jgi:hypothetical protein
MRRAIATLPDDVDELCLVRLGFQAHRLSAWPYLRRVSRAVRQGAEDARRADVGLLHSERFAFGWNHVGLLQYWRSFDALESWSRRPPHSDWWREVVDRGRSRDDFGLYHEVYLIPRGNLETIYLNCRPLGLATFGISGEPVGTRTTSRHRLGRWSS